MRTTELSWDTQLVGCTIAAHNYLPLVRVVARSFLDHHPDARFVAALIDHSVASRSLVDECFDVVPITEIDFGDLGFHAMATAYDVTEFATSIKPFLLRLILQTADCAVYLDPDIFVYAPLDPLINATFRAGWSLTPHCVQPMRREGMYPSEVNIMAAGVYNLGYVGVTRAALPFLEWWSERLRHQALIDPSNQLFTDQRWIDLAVPLFSPHIELSPAYNVAYWNVDQRPLERVGDVVMVGNEPLRFFHFSGYDRTAPWWLSKYQPRDPRVLLSDYPLVGELCQAHTEAVVAAGADIDEILPYGWADAYPGMPLDAPLRRHFHEALVSAARLGTEAPPAPFADGGAVEFRRWLSEPDPESTSTLPRFLDVLWRSRPDVCAAFPEVAHGRCERLWQWVRESGVQQSPGLVSLGLVEQVVAPRPAVQDGGRDRGGVDVVGYFSAELGTGEAARLLATSLRAARFTVSSIASKEFLSRQLHPFQTDQIAHHDTVILSVNADQLGAVRHQIGHEFFEGRHVIGMWFWEVEDFPERFDACFSMVHEVWAATEHIRGALAARSPSQPVFTMPLPLVVPPIADGVTKSSFGLSDRFMFLFSFDFLSVFERKNPLGVVEAFCAAFADGEGPMLLVKTINGHHRQQDLERLRWAARGRSDVLIRDGHIDPKMIGALTACCDCYVSLHRAEGLGLTMSEAMAIGKPVIATGYSGNLDFMTPSTAFLVPWTPARIGQSAAPYPPDGMWAEPDLSVAAQLMRHVVEDPPGAAAVGEAARADLAARFSPAVTGDRMRRRLEAIGQARYA